MDVFFIKENLKESTLGFNLLAEVQKKLMTPDVITAMQAGCHFDVLVKQEEKSFTITLKSREKVSILKALDNTPISVIVKP